MDCMLDIETMGTRPGCSVVEVAVVAFEVTTGEVMSEFVRRISSASNAAAGLVPDTATVEWHRERGRLPEILEYSADLSESLAEFSDWYGRFDFTRCWAKGASFDFPILEAAYRAVMVPFFEPRYSRLTCMRGITSLAGQKWVEPAHKGLLDCKRQVEDLVRALEVLGVVGVRYRPLPLFDDPMDPPSPKGYGVAGGTGSEVGS